MDRLTETLLNSSETDDDAVDQSTGAAVDEGAFDPIEVLDELDTVEDDAVDEDDEATDEDDGVEEPVDYKTLYEQDQAKIKEREDAIAAKESEVERQEQVRLMKQADAAWREEESKAVDWAEKHPNHKEAIAGLRQYYGNYIAQITKSAQALIQQAYSGQYIDQVASQAGLTAEDKAIIAAIDPKSAPAVAQALAAKNKAINDRLTSIEDKTKNLARGRQAQRRQLTGSDRPASGRGGGSNAQRIPYGSVENADFLLQATRALNGNGRER